MANGTIKLTRTGSGYLSGQILWSSESNGTQANTSTLTATLQIQRSAQNTTTGTFKGTFTVGGITEDISQFKELPSHTWVTLKTITVTVNHNADGTGNCYLYANINGPTGTTMAGTSVSGGETVTLDAIPRYAYLVTAPDFHDEENPVISYTNPIGTDAEALEACISLDGSRDDVAYRNIEKTGSSYTFSLTEAERDVLRTATTEGNSRTVRFFIRTKLGDAVGRSSLTRTFTIKDPEPTIQPVIRDTNSVTTALTGDSGKLIRYFSNAGITIGAKAVKKATLTSQKVTCGSKQLTADGTITGVESGKFVFSACDSRGNTAVKTLQVPFVSYIKLTCRLQSDVPDGEGNLQIRAEGSCFTGSFGAKSNSLKVYYRYKLQGGTYGSWQQMTATLSGNTYTAQADLTGLDYRSTYVFQTKAQDELSQVLSGEKIIKSIPVFDWSETDFRFNVPVSMAQNGLGVTGNKAITLTDANAGIATGWYRITGDTANGVGVAAIMRTDSTNESNLVQTAYAGGYSSQYYLIRQRCCHNGLWGEWEWVNPPLVADTEYQTTERYLTKPVFVKAVNFGALPASSSKTVIYSGAAATAVGLTLILSDGGIISAGYGLSRSTSGKVGIFAEATNYSVRVVTEADLTALTAYAVVKYIKT